MTRKKSGENNEEDDGELSDTTRAVLAIQRELESGESGGKRERRRHRSKSPDGGGGKRRRRGDSSDEPLGDGRTHGSVTGIKLGEFGEGGGAKSRKPIGGGGSIELRGKGGGKGPRLGMSLESLANRDSDDEGGGKPMPEAPQGTFRRSDIEKSMVPGGSADGVPKSARGIDGKMYEFLAEPDDGSDTEKAVAHTNSKLQKLKEAKQAMKGKDGDSKKKKGKQGDKKKKKKKNASSSSDASSETEKKKDKAKKKKDKKKKKKKAKKSSSSSRSS